MQLRTVHNITAAGDRAPRYLNQQISFGPEDAEGVLFPHQDPLVISAEVAGFEVRRILVDGGSSADVIFAEAYAKMGLPTLALTQAPASLRGFGGEAVQVLGQVQLVVAFGTSENRRKEQILFDAVDIPYNYNAIFCRTTLNKFDAISHHNYLKLKMPGPIVIKGLQPSPAPHGKVIKMQIDDADPTKLVLLGAIWAKRKPKTSLRISGRDIKAGVIEEIDHPEWLANPVLVSKMNGKWRMCVDFTILKKVCPKDDFPLPQIDQLVDSTAGCELMSFFDAYSGYHQIHMNPADIPKTAFITPFGTFCHLRMPFGLRNAGATFARLVYKVLYK
nr:uncharacterized protein LOC107279643 [Oryza sativa Japonica Group]